MHICPMEIIPLLIALPLLRLLPQKVRMWRKHHLHKN